MAQDMGTVRRDAVLDAPPSAMAPMRAGAMALRWRWSALAVTAAFLIVRLVSLRFNNAELFFDEAQYWLWAQTPAFGYFSKPPLLAWLIGAAGAVCGDSPFCVRLPSPLFHALTGLVVYALGARLIDRRTGFWAALLYATLPAVSLSSTLISTDVPLLLFWSLGLYAYVRLWQGGHAAWAVLLAVGLGLGLLSKYAMVYILPCAALHALMAGPSAPIRRAAFWVGVLGGLAIASPNLWWNATHQFATIGHTGENIGTWGNFPRFGELGEFVASQFAVMGPILFGLLLASFVRLPRENLTPAQGVLITFSAPILVIVALQALMAQAYANWAALAYVAGVVLVADVAVNHIPDIWRRATLALHLFVAAAIAIAVTRAGPGELPLPSGLAPFERMQGAEALAGEMRRLMAMRDVSGILVDDRRLAALLGYSMRADGVPVLSWRAGERPTHHFEMASAFQDAPRAPVLFVTRRSNPADVIARFDDAEWLGTFDPPAGWMRRVFLYVLDAPRPADPAR